MFMQITNTHAHSLQLHATAILHPLPMTGYDKFDPSVCTLSGTRSLKTPGPSGTRSLRSQEIDTQMCVYSLQIESPTHAADLKDGLAMVATEQILKLNIAKSQSLVTNQLQIQGAQKADSSHF